MDCNSRSRQYKEVDMDRFCIQTSQAPAAIGPYSQGVKAGKLVFVSGQLPLRPGTGELLTDIREATRQCLENVRAIVEAGGAGMESVVKVTVFLRDMNDFAAMNEVYQGYFATSPPARAAVQVAKLPRDAVVEIEAVAMTP
jgi:2-iminobutanoate/2-iminopropanoate deaminase